MEVGAMKSGVQAVAPQNRPSPGEDIERKRKDAAVAEQPSPEAKKVASEEILNKIKELTQDGQYSVHFENNREADKLVIRLYDSDSGELIRQIPPEEILGFASAFAEQLRGMLLDTQS